MVLVDATLPPRTAQGGDTHRRQSTTPFFSPWPVVTIEMAVASEPVPAVVGTCSSGSRAAPESWPTP